MTLFVHYMDQSSCDFEYFVIDFKILQITATLANTMYTFSSISQDEGNKVEMKMKKCAQ